MTFSAVSCSILMRCKLPKLRRSLMNSLMSVIWFSRFGLASFSGGTLPMVCSNLPVHWQREPKMVLLTILQFTHLRSCIWYVTTRRFSKSMRRFSILSRLRSLSQILHLQTGRYAWPKRCTWFSYSSWRLLSVSSRQMSTS